MKAQSTGKYSAGNSTLEILIAFAILIISITAVILVGFGNQSVTVDSETNNEGVSKAQKLLEDARASSRQDFTSVTSNSGTEVSGSLTYNKSLFVTDLTQCKKQATSTVTWSLSPLRQQKIELSTILTDIAGAIALGGDCYSDPPSSRWDNPQRFASDTINPGKTLSIDVLNKIVYLGADKPPFFLIADTRTATLGQTSGLIVGFTNGFDAVDPVYSLDAILWRDPSTGAVKPYVYAAMASSTAQLIVIDATDIRKPTIVASRSLLDVSPSGSYPEGYRLYSYKNRLYVVTKETLGRELHIYDTSDPANPTEIGGGTELTTTVNSMVIRDQFVSGTPRRIAYLATTGDTKEIRILDVTNDVVSDLSSVNLAGNQDGESVFLIGNKLYFGRQSSPSGADLYIYDVSNPVSPTPLGSKDIGTSVIGIRVSGNLGFLATSKTNKEFQVWNISNPVNITLIKEFNFGNIVAQGLDYEPDFIYATGQATPNFQILYSP